jgi:hypothetical protein
MKSFVQYFLEKYTDMGKLSPEQLRKGQRLDPNEEDNFRQVDGRVFHQALARIMENDAVSKISKKLKENITIYDVSDYMKMECFLGKNNSSGFAIKEGDELVSVFSSQESSGNAIVKEAIQRGAKRLDCYATQDKEGNIMNIDLPRLYSRFGFRVDESLTTGDDPSVPYTIIKGISYFVNQNEEVELTNPKVVVFMKI